MIRSDAPLKVRGLAEFGMDLAAPGMLYAALVRSPLPRARIRRLDLDGARSIPGVVAAVSAPEVREILSGASGDPERPIFPETEVRYRGEPIAAIAARTSRVARDAARAVRMELDPLPAVGDIEEVFPEWPGSGAGEASHVNAHVHARWGDPDAEFARAEHVVREQYRTNGIVQMALEPHACLARPEDGRWRVQSSTQTPFGVREDTAAILGIPEEKVVVEGSWVGGGFGGKGAALLEPYALVLAAASRAPVKLQLTYREEFELSRSTLPSIVRIESSLRHGKITARRARLLLDTGASLPGRDFATGYAIGFLAGPYRIPAGELEGYAVRTNKPPFGPHRAPFAPQCAFVEESHMDELARESKVDPLEFRIQHAWGEGDLTSLGQTVTSFGLAEALRRAQRIRERWTRELPEGAGIGIGVGFWSTGTGAGGEAEVVVGPSRVLVRTVEPEIGSGSVIRGVPRLVADRLGLAPEQVDVDRGDTSRSPYDTGVFGSRTTAALGQAAEAAAGAVLREIGRRMGGTAEPRLRLDGVELVAVAGSRERRVRDLLSPEESANGGLSAQGRHYGRGGNFDASRVLAGQFYAYTDFTASAHLAAVQVDRETGQVRVLRCAAIQDAGRVVDEPTFRAQVEGAVAMGLGEALTEETVWGPGGRLENPGLLDYRVPTLREIPPIEVEWVEGFPGAGSHGAKGGGEPPIIPVPAAVANAVAASTGARVREIPLTPERVARALKLL